MRSPSSSSTSSISLRADAAPLLLRARRSPCRARPCSAPYFQHSAVPITPLASSATKPVPASRDKSPVVRAMWPFDFDRQRMAAAMSSPVKGRYDNARFAASFSFRSDMPGSLMAEGSCRHSLIALQRCPERFDRARGKGRCKIDAKLRWRRKRVQSAESRPLVGDLLAAPASATISSTSKHESKGYLSMDSFNPDDVAIRRAHFIGGEYVDAGPRERIEVARPSDGMVYASVPLADAALMDRAVENAWTAFQHERLGAHGAARTRAASCAASRTWSKPMSPTLGRWKRSARRARCAMPPPGTCRSRLRAFAFTRSSPTSSAAK